ncbi:MAG: bifunctional 5,10-methylenetetrahydrofolate dehydrogenase/5,10-methenyltetrahydrofolate cyclohydrolase [Traorella sp.]
MENKYLYGKEIAKRIDDESKEFINQCIIYKRRIPKLVNICVGNKEASASYMKGLVNKCNLVGVDLQLVYLEENVSEFEMIRVIHNFNKMNSVDGILIQMPLPKHIDQTKVAMEIDPNKDVDGMHPLNTGKFYQNGSGFVPCTALAVMEFIHESGINLEGKNVGVIGRSNVIGKPVAQLCLNENASVTILHSKTQNIEEMCNDKDVLIVAVGKKKLVKKEWVKKGAIVIDVGINFDEGKMCGDVDLEDVIEKVSMISPVPKGVGVVTNSMLLRNVIKAYQNRG